MRNTDELILFTKCIPLHSRRDAREGIYEINGTIPAHLLNADQYHVKLYFKEDKKITLYHIDYVASFELVNEATEEGYDLPAGILRPEIAYTASFRKSAAPGITTG